MKIDLPYEIRQEIKEVVESATKIGWVQPPSDLMEKIMHRLEQYRSVKGNWLGYHEICTLQIGYVELN